MKKIACSALVSLFGSYSSATLRRPLCAISRSGYISANIAEAQQSATAGTAAALLACVADAAEAGSGGGGAAD